LLADNYQAGWFDLVDEVWVAVVPPEVAKQRIMERNNLTESQAEDRIRSQITNEQRTSHADLVIVTDRPKEETEAIVLDHYRELLQKINNNDLNTMRNKLSKM
jgi:dephospho-CoA kinase